MLLERMRKYISWNIFINSFYLLKVWFNTYSCAVINEKKQHIIGLCCNIIVAHYISGQQGRVSIVSLSAILMCLI